VQNTTNHLQGFGINGLLKVTQKHKPWRKNIVNCTLMIPRTSVHQKIPLKKWRSNSQTGEKYLQHICLTNDIYSQCIKNFVFIYITCTKGFHCDISHMHILYFGQINPLALLSFLFSLPSIFQYVSVSFLMPIFIHRHSVFLILLTSIILFPFPPHPPSLTITYYIYIYVCNV
jgi:hypothetical protein